MKQGLTKENFFNAMMEKYPKAMADFCKFVDEMKEKMGWNNLFNAGIYLNHTRQTGYDESMVTNTHSVAPKFHELPLLLQAGIFYIWTGIRLDDVVLDSFIEDGKGGFSEGLKEAMSDWEDEIKQVERRINGKEQSGDAEGSGQAATTTVPG